MTTRTLTLPKNYPASKTVRLEESAYKVVTEYARINDIQNFSDTLNIMLYRISRIGVEEFYEMTKVKVQK